MTSLPLVASDLLALLFSLLAPWAFVQSTSPGLEVAPPILFGLLALGLVPATAALRLYPGFGVHGVAELERSAMASIIVFGAFILSDFLNGTGLAFKAFLLTAALINAVAVPTFRSVTRRVIHRWGWWSQPLLVFGAEPDARRVSDYFSTNPSLGFSPVRISWDHAGSNGGLSYLLVAREPRVVSQLAERHRALCAAVPLGPNGTPGQEFFLEQCANVFPQLLIIPEPRSLPGFWTNSADIGGAVGLRVKTSLLNPLMRGAKRAMDWGFTIPIALLALPVFIAVALAVRLSSPGPIIYSSERIGKGRRRFRAWKFRTMYVNSDEALQEELDADHRLREEWERTNKLRRDPRITPVGRWLRRSSLDELPQLWNVLCGEMSLVGPRPVLPSEVARRGMDFGHYLSVLPGLTGLWQISGRSNTTYEERRRLDSYYVRNWSFWLDVHILVRTVRAVLTANGAH